MHRKTSPLELFCVCLQEMPLIVFIVWRELLHAFCDIQHCCGTEFENEYSLKKGRNRLLRWGLEGLLKVAFALSALTKLRNVQAKVRKCKKSSFNQIHPINFALFVLQGPREIHCYHQGFLVQREDTKVYIWLLQLQGILLKNKKAIFARTQQRRKWFK